MYVYIKFQIEPKEKYLQIRFRASKNKQNMYIYIYIQLYIHILSNNIASLKISMKHTKMILPSYFLEEYNFFINGKNTINL